MPAPDLARPPRLLLAALIVTLVAVLLGAAVLAGRLARPDDPAAKSAPSSVAPAGDGRLVLAVGLGEGSPHAAAIDAGTQLAVERLAGVTGIDDDVLPELVATPAVDPDEPAAAVVAAVAGTGADVVIADATTPRADEAAAQLAADGVLVVQPTTLPAHGDDGRATVHLSAGPRLVATTLARRVADDGHDHVVIVTDGGPAGEALATTTSEALRAIDEQADVAVVGHDGDPAATAAAVTAQQPDAVALVGAPGTAAVLPLLDDGVARYAAGAVAELDLAGALGGADPALDGLVLVRPGTTPDPSFAEQVQELAPELDGLTGAAEAHDAVVLAVLGSLAAGSDAGTALGGVLAEVASGGEACQDLAACLSLAADHADLDVRGASGPLALDGRGELTAGFLRLVTLDAAGRPAGVDLVFVEV